VKDSDTLFIYTGKFIPEKGPHILADAASRLLKKNNNIKVLLLGNGYPEYIKKIENFIVKENIEDRIIWHDTVPNKELFRFYSAADVAVWPKEASLSMMEAMACNLPIIISDASEVTERLEYNNGLIYIDGDPQSLSIQMEKLLDPKLRSDMGRCGRRLIEDKLNWSIIAAKFIELVK
jgi:glycosyltransferase involved in cell wall biosynthesis